MKEGKSKWGYVIFVLILFWLVSFAISSLLSQEAPLGDKIVIIPIFGPIGTTSTTIMPFETESATPSSIIKYIEDADKDSSIKGIILEINSPGGTVVASKEIANAVKNTHKPTVAWIREIGTSGAYWIASATDYIVADPLSITGSIGVMGSYMEFSELMRRYGITYQELKSGELKDMGNPFKKITEKEKKILQSKVDLIHVAFINEVARNRKLKKESVKKISDGSFYLGSEAYALGLVDFLGGKGLAINITKNAANITEYKLVKYEQKNRLIDLLGRLSAYSSFYIGRGIGSVIFDKANAESIAIELK